jgi:hypothetical protein
MSGKHVSGHCRWTVFSLIIILALFVTAASAASINTNVVYNKVTQTLQIRTTTAPVQTTCPTGCSCMPESRAKIAFNGVYKKCGDQPCYTPVTSAAQESYYCFGQGTTTTTPTPAPCPEGCTCISETAAKAKGGSWSRCSADICGYEQSTATLAAVVKEPKYCMKQESTTPVCPEGCSCISEDTAKARYGDYTRCSAEVCGYEQDQTKKYCIKQGSTTPVCPEGCTCISEANAKARYGDYTRCSAEVCGYEQDQTKKYCIKQGSTTPVCPEGCVCLTDKTAKEKFGTYTRCSADVCGKEVFPAANGVAAYSEPQYCVKQGSTTQACPQGCYCLQDAEARLKFGPNNYTRCQADPCDSASSATSANSNPRYCFKPTITAIPFGCPQGCYCTTNKTAVEKKLTFCGGKLTPCGYNENKEPQYCFEQGSSPTCVYDYQKNVCTGTCPEGYTCGLLASKKDATGKVTYGVCGCTGQPTTACTYDTQKNACTGTCANQQSCAIVGKKVDEKTGETFVVCGCPTNTACTYNYAKDACVGTCTATGEICQLNTIYRDPATGKVAYAECHCKGQPTTACSYDTQKNACTGTCANQQSCEIVGKKVDEKTGETFVVCGCPQPTSGQCTFDKEKQTCNGACQSGAACTILSKKTDDKTGEVYVSCGCPPQPSSCVYDYSKEACAGTCTATGDICQLNTIYRDPTTGKVTYAECHCKGGGAETCAFNTESYCVGSCPQGGQCANSSVVDVSGKMSFICTCASAPNNCVLTANNECSGTCANQQPCARIVTKDDSGQEKVRCECGSISPAGTTDGIFESIARFLSKLLGGK